MPCTSVYDVRFHSELAQAAAVQNYVGKTKAYGKLERTTAAPTPRLTDTARHVSRKRRPTIVQAQQKEFSPTLKA
jgi:hypothetical protein